MLDGVTPHIWARLVKEAAVTVPSQRMKEMRARRRAGGLREVRLVVPDLRRASVRQRMAAQVAGLDRAHEDEALDWIETVSEFDARDGR